MKSESGITLISLTMYIVVFSTIVLIMSAVSTFFYKNVSTVNSKGEERYEIDKFNMYFLEDIKNNSKVEINDESNKITFYQTNNIYLFNANNNTIYRNNVKLCSNVEEFKVSRAENTENSKNIISVNMIINNQQYSQEYTLKY